MLQQVDAYLRRDQARLVAVLHAFGREVLELSLTLTSIQTDM